jgi:hypothetical protein
MAHCAKTVTAIVVRNLENMVNVCLGQWNLVRSSLPYAVMKMDDVRNFFAHGAKIVQSVDLVPDISL